MHKQSHGLVYRVAIYFFGNICSKLITFLLTRFQTAALTVEIFGPATLLASTLPQLVSICFFEIWAGALRFMYDDESLTHKHKVFTNALASAGLLLPFFFLATYFLNASQGATYYGELLLMGVLCLLDYLYQFNTRGIGRNKLFVVTGIVSTFVLGISQLVCLVFLKLGAVSLIISPACASFVSILIYEWKTKQLCQFRWREVDGRLMRQLLKFSFPLSLNATAYVIMTKFNEFYVQNHIDDAALGLLSAANRISMIVNIFISVFTLAWQETAFSMSQDEKRNLYFSSVLASYIRLLTCGVLILIPYTGVIFRILIQSGGGYEGAKALVPTAILAVVLSALSSFVGNIFNVEKRSHQLFWSTLIGGVCNGFFMVCTLPVFGIQTANLGLIIGFTVTLMVRVWMLRDLIRFTIPKKLILTVICLISLVFVSFYLCPQPIVQVITCILAPCVGFYLVKTEIKAILTKVLPAKK